MGLIRTAIMTGGGVYAISKLSKAAEKRDNNSQSQPSYVPQYGQQNPSYPQSYGGPSMHQQSGAYYTDSQQQRQWGPEQYDQRCNQGYVSAPYNDSRYQAAEGSCQHPDQQSNNPPAYYQQSPTYNAATSRPGEKR